MPLERLELLVPKEMLSDIENVMVQERLATISAATRFLIQTGVKQVSREAART